MQVVTADVGRNLGLDLPENTGALVLGFVAGRPRAVARRLDESARLLGESGATHVETLDEPAARNLLAGLTDLPWSDANPPELAVKVTLLPNNVAMLLEDLGGDGGSGQEWSIIADPGLASFN